MNNKKITGSYYTPSWLSDFIIGYIENNLKFSDSISVLEPSCGDGVFVESIKKSLIAENIRNIIISDVDEDALKKASSFSGSFKIKSFLGDFLKLSINNKFDLVIGNPPYIHKKYLSEEQKESCLEWYKYAGFEKKRVLNIWPAFLYKSESLLTSSGLMVFVIPEELVRVNYAKDTLNFLKDRFDRLEIYSLNKVIFGDAGQNTLVLFAYKKHKEKGTFSGQILIKGDKKDNLEYINHNLSTNNFDLLTQKELGTELCSDDLIFINKISSELKEVGEISKSQTGVVTGANDFFIISEENKDNYKLDNFCIPIIRKGYYTKDSLNFTKEDFKKLLFDGKPSYLLEIIGDIVDKELLNYIELGEKEGINKRYKCGTYKPNWYNIPNIWGAKLVFFKRSHIAPKLIYNSSMINVTDSGYRITLDNNKYKEFQYCFYNSFTLLMMELGGRTYGGGVLEVTPNEFKKVPMPFFDNIPIEILDLFSKRKLSNIEEILIDNDKYILGERLGLSKYEIKRIQGLRKKLLDKRLNKKNILK